MRLTLENDNLKTTLFHVAQMDCAAEENLIRMALEHVDGIESLRFELGERNLFVNHRIDPDKVLELLSPLKLGASPLQTHEALEGERDGGESKQEQAKALKILLAINGSMFVVEFCMGLLAQSAGLIADSLDMLADAGVYGISLVAVYRAKAEQRQAARVAGWLQALLAAGVLLEVVRRFLYGSDPESVLMLLVGAIALVANVACLAIIHRHRDGGVHMKASWIFSANDVLANFGVLLAGALVMVTGSNYPDLVIGVIIGFVVLYGARRILSLARPE